ncbi:hypothetical protein AALO_G00201510 [Alosa alosa]|uniref:Uncharacterized protein n=1 Tax=Alosa alosa TaxID=278164 RepID=A0AAV6G7K2_9TELE|nr:hypothetical protein AALO_G00201510 [Alosa alosa]
MQGPNGRWFYTSDREIETVEPLPVVLQHVVESVLKARQTLASALSFFRDPAEHDEITKGNRRKYSDARIGLTKERWTTEVQCSQP